MIVVSVVLIKTLRFTSRQLEVDPQPRVAINGEKIAEYLSNAIQFRTISYGDTGQFDGKEFSSFHRYLEQRFPKVHSTLIKEVVGGYSLLYTWKGQTGGTKPIL
ncbi:MAG: hypothetical protein V3U42_04060, partial [candidate division NC10 bacterium]